MNELEQLTPRQRIIPSGSCVDRLTGASEIFEEIDQGATDEWRRHIAREACRRCDIQQKHCEESQTLIAEELKRLGVPADETIIGGSEVHLPAGPDHLVPRDRLVLKFNLYEPLPAGEPIRAFGLLQQALGAKQINLNGVLANAGQAPRDILKREVIRRGHPAVEMLDAQELDQAVTSLVKGALAYAAYDKPRRSRHRTFDLQQCREMLDVMLENTIELKQLGISDASTNTMYLSSEMVQAILEYYRGDICVRESKIRDYLSRKPFHAVELIEQERLVALQEKRRYLQDNEAMPQTTIELNVRRRQPIEDLAERARRSQEVIQSPYISLSLAMRVQAKYHEPEGVLGAIAKKAEWIEERVVDEQHDFPHSAIRRLAEQTYHYSETATEEAIVAYRACLVAVREATAGHPAITKQLQSRFAGYYTQPVEAARAYLQRFDDLQTYCAEHDIQVSKSLLRRVATNLSKNPQGAVEDVVARYVIRRRLSEAEHLQHWMLKKAIQFYPEKDRDATLLRLNSLLECGILQEGYLCIANSADPNDRREAHVMADKKTGRYLVFHPDCNQLTEQERLALAVSSNLDVLLYGRRMTLQAQEAFGSREAFEAFLATVVEPKVAEIFAKDIQLRPVLKDIAAAEEHLVVDGEFAHRVIEAKSDPDVRTQAEVIIGLLEYANLTSEEEFIIRRLYGLKAGKGSRAKKPATIGHIAAELSMSRREALLLEKSALEKLQEALLSRRAPVLKLTPVSVPTPPDSTSSFLEPESPTPSVPSELPSSDPVPEYDIYQMSLMPALSQEVKLLKADEEVELMKIIEAGVFAEEALKALGDRGGLPDSLPFISSETRSLYATAGELREDLEKLVAQGTMAHTKFFRANVGLVKKAAARLGPTLRSMTMDDLVHEGYLGLLTAIQKFEYKRGTKFSTYATSWIAQSMKRGLANKNRLIRLPVYLYEEVSNMNTASNRLMRDLGREPTIEELAESIGKSPEKIEELKALMKRTDPLGLDVQVGDEEEAPLSSFDNNSSIQTVEEEIFAHSEYSSLHEAFAQLDNKSKEILDLRFGLTTTDKTGKTQSEIATMLGISVATVRKYESLGLRKMQRLLPTDS